MKAGDKRPLRPWLIAGTTSQRRTASRRRSSSNFPTTEQQQFPNNRIEAPNISFHLGLACQPDSPRLLSSCCLLRQGAEGGWGKFGVDFCTSAAAKHCDNSTFEYVLDWFQISLETGLEPDVIHEHRFNQFFIHHSLCAAQVRQKLTFPEELLPLDCKSALENYFASDYSCSMFRCLLSVCSCTDPVSLSACLWSVFGLSPADLRALLLLRRCHRHRVLLLDGQQVELPEPALDSQSANAVTHWPCGEFVTQPPSVK